MEQPRALAIDHMAGRHRERPVEGCPTCRRIVVRDVVMTPPVEARPAWVERLPDNAKVLTG